MSVALALSLFAPSSSWSRDTSGSMWMLICTALARDFGRQDQALRTTRYARLVGEGPVVGKWRNRRGAFVASRFPDGQIEHVDRFDGKTLAETRLFSAAGAPVATVDWEAETVTLHLAPERTVAFSSWEPLPVEGLVLRAPPDRQWVFEVQAAADPFEPQFATDLAVACGCEVEASMTVWLGGRVGAHFRLHRAGETADLVAVPGDAGLLVMSAAGKDLGALSTLRAMMATAREAP